MRHIRQHIKTYLTNSLCTILVAVYVDNILVIQLSKPLYMYM